jgi:hypothetical protein
MFLHVGLYALAVLVLFLVQLEKFVLKPKEDGTLGGLHLTFDSSTFRCDGAKFVDAPKLMGNEELAVFGCFDGMIALVHVVFIVDMYCYVCMVCIGIGGSKDGNGTEKREGTEDFSHD